MKYISNIIKKIMGYTKKDNLKMLGIGAMVVLPKTIEEALNGVGREEKQRRTQFNNQNYKHNPGTRS